MRNVPAFDGLRALAVMLVFLFHTRHVPGGWVGVDIFFAAFTPRFISLNKPRSKSRTSRNKPRSKSRSLYSAAI